VAGPHCLQVLLPTPCFDQFFGFQNGSNGNRQARFSSETHAHIPKFGRGTRSRSCSNYIFGATHSKCDGSCEFAHVWPYAKVFTPLWPTCLQFIPPRLLGVMVSFATAKLRKSANSEGLGVMRRSPETGMERPRTDLTRAIPGHRRAHC
jgi:hypothetical protein